MATPAASAARKVMMAMTAPKDRPAIESRGTIAVGPRRAAIPGMVSRSPQDRAAVLRAAVLRPTVSKGSLVDMQSSFVQDQTARVVLVHERNVVRGDHHRGAEPIEFDEQP